MIRNLPRRTAMVVVALLLPALLAPGAALAATLSKKVFKGGAEVKECFFTVVKEKCEIEFLVVGEGEGWRVESNEFMGEKAEERYKKTVGCTLKKLLKGGEKCKDVIEMVKKEAGTMNGYCVLWELENGGLTKVPFCTPLKM
jgi:hypothetical protein